MNRDEFWAMVIGILMGFGLGMSIGVLIESRLNWRPWAIEQGYASYHPQTGEIVYKESEDGK